MTLKLTDSQRDEVWEALRPLFASAVAQGMHAPFALDCDYWGRDYADRALDAIAGEPEE